MLSVAPAGRFSGPPDILTFGLKSVIVMLLMVTFPVFITVNVYSIVSPASL